MPHAKNFDLHGNVPETSRTALVIVDVLNDLEFDGGKRLLPQALKMAHKLAGLKQKLKRRGIVTIYVNDNFGKWKSDFHSVIDHCLGNNVLGKPIAEILHPQPDD